MTISRFTCLLLVMVAATGVTATSHAKTTHQSSARRHATVHRKTSSHTRKTASSSKVAKLRKVRQIEAQLAEAEHETRMEEIRQQGVPASTQALGRQVALLEREQSLTAQLAAAEADLSSAK